MADQIRIIDRLIQTKPFDLRALLRLATWGCVAATALMVAVLSASMGTKHQAFAPSTAAPQVPAATVALTTRQTEPDKATRQLSEAVSGLAADRDRLVARIASLERSLEDVTGSIKQQAALSPAPAQSSVHVPTTAPAGAAAQAGKDSSGPAPASGLVSAPRPIPAPGPTPTATAAAPTPGSSTPGSPTSPASRSQTQPEKATPTAAAPPAAAPSPTAPPGAIATSPPASAAAPPSAPPTRVANLPEAADPEGKSRIVDFGLDIGGATTFDGLRALWNSVRNNTADLFDDLHPMVAVRENKSRGVDLRLVVGPIGSSEAATQMCATLLAARRFCQMTVFEGQPLPQASAMTEPDARRPPPAVPARTPPQAKTVRPPAPKQ
jgi:hypothetical protein